MKPQAQRRYSDKLRTFDSVNFQMKLGRKNSDFLGEEEEIAEISSIISGLETKLADNSTHDSYEIVSILRRNSYTSVSGNGEYALLNYNNGIPRVKNPLYRD